MSRPSRQGVRRVRCQAALFLTLAIVLSSGAAASCSSSNSSSRSSTTTGPSGFQVTTPEGQVSLSLNGKLPPNWPADVPVPSGATPAGSGSLVGSSKGVMIGVYETSAPAETTFQYYTSPPAGSSVQTESPSTIGSGSTFVGKVKLTSPVTGDVIVLPSGGRTLIVIVLQTGGASGSTSSMTGGTATTG